MRLRRLAERRGARSRSVDMWAQGASIRAAVRQWERERPACGGGQSKALTQQPLVQQLHGALEPRAVDPGHDPGRLLLLEARGSHQAGSPLQAAADSAEPVQQIELEPLAPLPDAREHPALVRAAFDLAGGRI